MTEIESYLETIEPELRVLTRIFGFPESVWDEPRKFVPLSEEKEGRFYIAFAADGHRVERSTPAPEDADERIRTLHRRRAARRLCKQTLYDLLKEMTGIQPPWGSLTGVRPTHLMLEALEEGLTPEAAIERLAADFDVAPDRAALLAEIAAEQRKLPKPGDEWMDVYIGIPFCTTRCAYCSFSSGEIGDGSLIEPYMASLTREMRACAEILKDSGRKLRALYVGGGTPTALPQGALEQLMEETVRCFPGAMEYTVEAGRPDTLTREKLRASLTGRTDGRLQFDVSAPFSVEYSQLYVRYGKGSAWGGWIDTEEKGAFSPGDADRAVFAAWLHRDGQSFCLQSDVVPLR